MQKDENQFCNVLNQLVMNKRFLVQTFLCCIGIGACSPPKKTASSIQSLLYYERGRDLEAHDATCRQADSLFKQAFDGAHKAEKQKYAIAYARCFIRTHKQNAPMNVLAHIAPKSIEYKHLELYNLHQQLATLDLSRLRLHSDSLKKITKQVRRIESDLIDKEILKDSLGQRSNYYLGIAYQLLSEKWLFDLKRKNHSKSKDYLSRAKLLLNKVTMTQPWFPEEYHKLGYFYYQQSQLAYAKQLFLTGQPMNEGNLNYQNDYAWVLLGSFKLLKDKFQYNFFCSMEAADIQNLNDVVSDLQKKLEQPKLEPLTHLNICKSLIWCNALKKAQGIGIPQSCSIPKQLLERSEDLNFYHGLNHWLDGNPVIAFLKCKESQDKGIKAMNYFWLGYFSEPMKQLPYFEKAIETARETGDVYSDALYYKGITLQNQEKKWKSTSDFDILLEKNPNYGEARERRAYALLAQGKKKKALLDFNYLEAAPITHYKTKGIIGRAMIFPKDLKSLPTKPTMEQYDPYFFLENCLKIKMDRDDTSKFVCYDYVKRYQDSFEQDYKMTMIREQSKLQLDISKLLDRPHIVWYAPNAKDEDPLFWQKDTLTLEFTIRNIEKFKLRSTEIWVDNTKIKEVTPSELQKSQVYKCPIPTKPLLKSGLDLLTNIKIKARYKRGNKTKVVERIKKIEFQKTHVSKCSRRIAFVFQNNNYMFPPILSLPKKHQEMEDLKQLLEAQQFYVKTYKDLTRDSFINVLDKDYTKAIQDYDLILFYYTGHGIFYQGSNCMLPVDYKKIQNNMVATDSIFAKIDKKLAGFSKERRENNIVFVHIFDMCRQEQGNSKNEKNFKEPQYSKSDNTDYFIPNSIIVYATAKGMSIRTKDPKTSSNKTVYMTHLPKKFAIADKYTDIVELFDIRSMFTNADQTPEFFYNLKFKVFLKKPVSED